MGKQESSGRGRPEVQGETSNTATEREKTVDELIHDMIEANRPAQIETNEYVAEVAKRLRTRVY